MYNAVCSEVQNEILGWVPIQVAECVLFVFFTGV